MSPLKRFKFKFIFVWELKWRWCFIVILRDLAISSRLRWADVASGALNKRASAWSDPNRSGPWPVVRLPRLWSRRHRMTRCVKEFRTNVPVRDAVSRQSWPDPQISQRLRSLKSGHLMELISQTSVEAPHLWWCEYVPFRLRSACADQRLSFCQRLWAATSTWWAVAWVSPECPSVASGCNPSASRTTETEPTVPSINEN